MKIFTLDLVQEYHQKRDLSANNVFKFITSIRKDFREDLKIDSRIFTDFTDSFRGILILMLYFKYWFS